MRMRFTVLGAVLIAPLIAAAEPPGPQTAPGITLADYGVYCRQVRNETEPAPGTSSGFVRLLPDHPQFVFRQQQVPARLGISFGVSSVADRDLPAVRIEVWVPGATQPETWMSEQLAGDPSVRGFTFDHAHELVTGRWRMEAWDGATLLYRVEFDVLPGTALPGISSDCDVVS